ncbi:MAG: rhodanese-like domain-containing protein [Lachnospiraceae bacterium]|nr:rhodanese-like domain-containing protein [Lachnospiraceae bacterium]
MTFENINIRQIVNTAVIKNAIIIDVRDENRFLKGHIPMAVNLPLSKIKSGYISYPKSRTLIVYCDTGGASMQAARLLSQKGYTVINCIGGLNNYKGSLTRSM